MSVKTAAYRAGWGFSRGTFNASFITLNYERPRKVLAGRCSGVFSADSVDSGNEVRNYVIQW